MLLCSFGGMGGLGLFLGVAYRYRVGLERDGFLFDMSTCTGVPGLLYDYQGGYCSLFCSSTRNGTVFRTWAHFEDFFFQASVDNT